MKDVMKRPWTIIRQLKGKEKKGRGKENKRQARERKGGGKEREKKRHHQAK